MIAKKRHCSQLPKGLFAQTSFAIRFIAAIVVVFLLHGRGLVFAQEIPVPKAQIVIFTPSDIEPPPKEEYQERLRLFGLMTEKFFIKELKRWDHNPRQTEFFRRGDDGKISVIHIKGSITSKDDLYKANLISGQVYHKLKDAHNIQPAGNYRWIFVYVGDPPRKFEKYVGAGNSSFGGYGLVNYTNVRTKVDLEQPLVSSAHNKIYLKGCIHELGHGFGLPHIGPKVELKLGNTLMGPVTALYVKNKLPRKTKAYLSEANAAMLSVHPLFTGTTESRSVLPSPEFEDTKVLLNQKDRTIVVTGKLEPTDVKPRSVLVFDNRDDNKARNPEYWAKAFVSNLDEESQFSVAIPNPSRSGKIKLVVVYENGAVTGDGKLRGIRGAKIIPYSFN